MKKAAIAVISALAVCMCFAACKSTTSDKPENSVQSRPESSNTVIDSSAESSMENSIERSLENSAENSLTSADDNREDEAERGVVTDDNGLIGDGDDKDKGDFDDIEDKTNAILEIVKKNAR